MGSRRRHRFRAGRHRPVHLVGCWPRAVGNGRRQGDEGGAVSGRAPHARGAGAAGPAFRAVLESRPVARIDICRDAGLPLSRGAAGYRMDRTRHRRRAAADAPYHCVSHGRSCRRMANRVGQQQHPGEFQRRHQSPVVLLRGRRLRHRSAAVAADDRRSRGDARGIPAGAAQHDRPRLGPGLLQHQQLVPRPEVVARRSTATRRTSNTPWASSIRSTS